jgi:proteasome beta subunit
MSQQIWIPGACSVAITCQDGVVLGNENRNTWGNMVTSKSMKKVFSLTPTIGLTTSGLIGDFQTLVRIMRAQANLYKLESGTPISTRAMAKLIANFLYQRKRAPLFVNVTIAGVDADGPKLYTLDAIGSLMQDDIGVSGSATELSIGILEAEWRKDMTVEEGKKLIEKAVRVSLGRDVLSGDGIDILVITSAGSEEIHIKLDEISE